MEKYTYEKLTKGINNFKEGCSKLKSCFEEDIIEFKKHNENAI